MVLEAPRGQSSSVCGFTAGFAGLPIHQSRRSRGNGGIPAGISKGCGKGGKPALWLSMPSIPRHFHGLFLDKSRFSASSELSILLIVIDNWLGAKTVGQLQHLLPPSIWISTSAVLYKSFGLRARIVEVAKDSDSNHHSWHGLLNP